jgi:hypothetical protein
VDTIFKTLLVKATTVSVRLQIYLCALKIPTEMDMEQSDQGKGIIIGFAFADLR